MGRSAGEEEAGKTIKTGACRAPFTSLHVDQFGDARPCCQSSRILGNVGERSLEDIWTGEPLAELRTAVAAGDLSLGCEHCAWAGRHGREATYAVRFDHDRIPGTGEGPSRLELAPSNSCNLQCTMCNGDWSSSIRLHREGRPALPRVFGDAQLAQVQDLAAGLDQLHLFGGEPFLMPEALRLLEIALEAGARCTVTTNGSVLTARVERLLDRPGIDLAVSIDGLGPEVYESIRVGASWENLMEHLDRFQQMAARHGNRVDVAHCLMTSNWWQFPDFLTWATGRKLGVYVNDVLSPEELSLHHLSPPEMAAVVGQLDRRGGEVEALGPPWRDTWRRSLDGLRQSLDDGAHGSRHGHLGDLSPADVAPNRDPENDSRLIAALFTSRRTTRARVDVALDPELRVTAATTTGEPEAFSLVDLDGLVGRSSAEVRTLMAHGPPESRSVVCWGVDRTVEERRFGGAGQPGNDEDGPAERRTISSGPGGARLSFEYWLPPSAVDEAEAIAAIADGGEVVELRIDDRGVLRHIEPSHIASSFGLQTEIGITCLAPTDVLDARRSDPVPDFRADEIEPGLVAVELTWLDGHHLVGLARTSTKGTTVRLARLASGTP